MTHRWNQTIEIDKNLATKLIETQHHLFIDAIMLLDEGWDNLVYLINHKHIFRFPRREQGIVCMENEIALLPFIGTQVSFPFSCPKWIGKCSDLYPYPFSGYTMLDGKPLCDVTSELIDDTNLAYILATWLKELHSIKVTDEYAVLLKGGQSWRLNVSQRVSRCRENITQYEKYFVQAGFDKSFLLDVVAILSHLEFTDRRESYLHGDLYSRHIIVNPTNLVPTGLIDWGDVHIGPPGIDLAVSMIFTEKAFKAFLNAYDVIDNETRHIMLFHAFCHTISFLPYAYEKNKKSLKRWASLVLTRVIAKIHENQSLKKLIR